MPAYTEKLLFPLSTVAADATENACARQAFETSPRTLCLHPRTMPITLPTNPTGLPAVGRGQRLPGSSSGKTRHKPSVKGHSTSYVPSLLPTLF